jgi:hypothetical protein
LNSDALLSVSVWIQFEVGKEQVRPIRVGVMVDTHDGTEDKWLAMVIGSIDIDQGSFERTGVVAGVLYLTGLFTHNSGHATDSSIDVLAMFAWNPTVSQERLSEENAAEFVNAGPGK